jgi:hypothetical protein
LFLGLEKYQSIGIKHGPGVKLKQQHEKNKRNPLFEGILVLIR